MDYYGSMLRTYRFSLLLATFCLLINVNAQTLEGKAKTSVASIMDGQLFYQLLLGELNARAGDPGAGYSLILDAARKTKDARLYQRAVDIALQARSGDSALLAARAWLQALPNSKQANLYLLQILISLNRVTEALEPLKREIATTSPLERPMMMSSIARFLARVSDKKQAVELAERALQDYLKEPSVGVEAWTVVGRMRVEAGDPNGALTAAREALAIDPTAQGAVLLALSVIDPALPEAELIVKKHLENQQQPQVRMAYVRALLNSQRYTEANTHLQIALRDKPDLKEAWLLKGALELQNERYSDAELSFKQYLDLALDKTLTPGSLAPDLGVTQSLLSLSQIAEQKQDFAAAEAWLQRIARPVDRLTVPLKRAGLLARQGRLQEALELIRSQEAQSPTEARLIAVSQAELLRDNKQFADAYKVLSEARERQVEDLDLAYDLAMIAEKLGKVDEMEHLLRFVIAAKPDHHHAYNALGYSLAERNTRLPEARQLVLKALALAPDDPFIMDSMGWVEFRSGNIEESRRLLQNAFNIKPDAEIAAHLGEVLWTMGRKSQALSIWKDAEKLNAKNETLLETIKRFRREP